MEQQLKENIENYFKELERKNPKELTEDETILLEQYNIGVRNKTQYRKDNRKTVNKSAIEKMDLLAQEIEEMENYLTANFNNFDVNFNFEFHLEEYDSLLKQLRKMGRI